MFSTPSAAEHSKVVLHQKHASVYTHFEILVILEICWFSRQQGDFFMTPIFCALRACYVEVGDPR